MFCTILNLVHILINLILSNPIKKVAPIIIIPILQLHNLGLMEMKWLVQGQPIRVPGSALSLALHLQREQLAQAVAAAQRRVAASVLPSGKEQNSRAF